eukprot:scaffold65471_cov22-Prasinocladus_malaysianus.AAC.1
MVYGSLRLKRRGAMEAQSSGHRVVIPMSIVDACQPCAHAFSQPAPLYWFKPARHACLSFDQLKVLSPERGQGTIRSSEPYLNR